MLEDVEEKLLEIWAISEAEFDDYMIMIDEHVLETLDLLGESGAAAYTEHYHNLMQLLWYEHIVAD